MSYTINQTNSGKRLKRLSSSTDVDFSLQFPLFPLFPFCFLAAPRVPSPMSMSSFTRKNCDFDLERQDEIDSALTDTNFPCPAFRGPTTLFHPTTSAWTRICRRG